MEIINNLIENYIADHTSHESAVLKKLDRDTYANILMPRMLSGHVQGRLLSMFSNMIKPSAILEIGTFTGYSAICLSEGLSLRGKLITIDINEELESMVRKYFTDANVDSKIEYIIGNALEVIPTIKLQFDIVFIDADKCNYSNYYDLVFDKVKSGGYIIADNVLWSGKVVSEEKSNKDLLNIKLFNQKVQDDLRVENLIIPMRDGLMVARKK